MQASLLSLPAYETASCNVQIWLSAFVSLRFVEWPLAAPAACPLRSADNRMRKKSIMLYLAEAVSEQLSPGTRLLNHGAQQRAQDLIIVESLVLGAGEENELALHVRQIGEALDRCAHARARNTGNENVRAAR